MSSQGEIIKYVPFSSFINPSFWHRFTDLKLDVDKLQETTKQIFGRFTCRADIGAVFEVDGTSFNKSPEKENFYTNVKGTIMNKNIVEDYIHMDKASLLNSLGEIIWANLKQKEWIDNPNLLLNFFILSFVDLKKFYFFHWFAYPAPSKPIVYLKEKSTSIKDHFSTELIQQFTKSYYNTLDVNQKCFFVLFKKDDTVRIEVLKKVLQLGEEPDAMTTILDTIRGSETYLVFNDPSNGENPGWPLRIFIAVLLDHCPDLAGSDIRFIGLRCDSKGSFEHSRIFLIHLPQDIEKAESAGWVGWERNTKGSFGPKLTRMAESMDPVQLADTASELNVKLMKWRLAPDINLKVMKSTKCLLLGAGTLGCHVARNLLAWGFRHITFIDHSYVAHSNPTRQSLFTFKECTKTSRNKAVAAAEYLRTILPTVKSKGIALHIPTPEHEAAISIKEETASNIKLLEDAIVKHDAVFLLLDTREARWIPTIMAARHGKIVINAALGFDSYLVMRHGVANKSPAGVKTSQPGGTTSHDGGSTSQDSGSTSQDAGSTSRDSGSTSQDGGNASEDGGSTSQDGGNTSQDGGNKSQNVETKPVEPSWIPGGELGCYFCNDITAPGDSTQNRTLDQQCTVTRPGAAAIAGAYAVEMLVALLQHPRRVQAPAICNLSNAVEKNLPAELQGVLGPIPHSIRGFLHNYQTVMPTCVKFNQCVACSDVVINKYKEQGLEFLLDVLNCGKYLEKITGLYNLHLSAGLSDILTFSSSDDED